MKMLGLIICYEQETDYVACAYTELEFYTKLEYSIKKLVS